MKFLNIIVNTVLGHKAAVNADYSGASTNVEEATLPADVILLGTDPVNELAVRIVAESNAQVAVLGNEIAINVGVRSVGRDPAELVKLGADLKAALVAAGAPANFVDSPRNFGAPTLLSYFNEPSDDMTDYITQLCDGNSDYNEAYLGNEPPDRRRAGVGNDGLYAVYSDADATTAAKAVASDHISEMVAISPEYLQAYIDAGDATNAMLLAENGGRGGLLACDGAEHEVTVTDGDVTTTVYVYRKG